MGNVQGFLQLVGQCMESFLEEATGSMAQVHADCDGLVPIGF